MRAHGSGRRWQVAALVGAPVAVGALAALMLLPAGSVPTSAADSYRTSYFASTGEVCDLALTPHVVPYRAMTSQIALWRLSTLDLPSLAFVNVTPTSEAPNAQDEVARIAENAELEIAATLRAYVDGATRTEVVARADCERPVRTSESGEQPIDVAAVLAGRVPTGLLTGADFEGVFVTTSGTVCEIATRVIPSPGSPVESVAALRDFLARVDLSTLPTPEPSGGMTMAGFEPDDAEASAWISGVVEATFAYATDLGFDTSGFGMEGSYRCDP